MQNHMDLHGGYEYSFKPLIDFTTTILPAQTWSKYDKAMTLAALPILGEETNAEVDGIMEACRERNITILKSQLMMFQIFYEVIMQCTGVVVRDQNRTVIHGRNMDIGLEVGNITAEVTF